MPRFCANLSLLFTEIGFLDRFAAAARYGFRAVEYWFPYAYDKGALAEQLDRHGLVQVLFNLPAGDWEGGERGIACLPERTGEFQDGVGLALDYARALGCRLVNCLVGKTPVGADPARVHETLVSNLRFAARALEGAGVRLVVEALNTRDVPGFHLTGTRQAARLLDAVGHPAAALLYDVYHMQVMEGDLIRTIREHLPRIAHVQIADNPGRHEPGSGEINFPNLFRALDEAGYTGWVGCEYRPSTTTAASLGWIRPYLAAA
ncbi:MAG TPA: hydroxypyruvate isomerase [Thermodesulfobacteriota bacterium]|nr:hydroxypyruvate isomerase [Thermodesulfobacteriota bacterium]